jgi:hypothetical protein
MTFITPLLLVCALGSTSPVCSTKTYLLRIDNAFCLEEERVCCTETQCEIRFGIACYPNKVFVGNFESILANKTD